MEVKLKQRLPLPMGASWSRPVSRGLYEIGGEECIVSEIRVEERYTETAIWRTAKPEVTYTSDHFHATSGTAKDTLEEIGKSEKPSLREMMGW